MSTDSGSEQSVIEILEVIGIENPKIAGLLSLGCGRKMGWGNNCHIRHLCYYCQAVRAEISRHELEEMMLCVELITKDKSTPNNAFQNSYRDLSDIEIIERIQRYMVEAQVEAD